MNEIRILDKNFREFIPEEDIKFRIEELARQINNDLSGKDVVFLGISEWSLSLCSRPFQAY